VYRSQVSVLQWNENQIKSETSFKNGRIDGSVKQFHENGKLQLQSFWKEGKGNGELKEYYEKDNYWPKESLKMEEWMAHGKNIIKVVKKQFETAYKNGRSKK
jgi:antitoxin component YwqK of YwqJK toxin-antitoxin module